MTGSLKHFIEGGFRLPRHCLTNLTNRKKNITKRGKILLQIAAAFFITNCDKNLLQNAAAHLLQNASSLLQNAAGITERVDFITKRGRYYKMWHNSMT